MAFADYGAIGFRNGILINTKAVMPMKETVHWVDSKDDVNGKGEPINLNDNYTLYIGDEYCTIAFYKGSIVIAEMDDYDQDFYDVRTEWFEFTNYKWSSWETYAGYNDVKVTKRHGYYVLKWTYYDDKYEVYFGHGVDYDWYKKTGWVNYFRTNPKYLWQKFKNWVYDIFHRR